MKKNKQSCYIAMLSITNNQWITISEKQKPVRLFGPNLGSISPYKDVLEIRPINGKPNWKLASKLLRLLSE